MKRIVFAGAVALVMSLGFISPVTADKTEGKGEITPLADKVPAPDALKLNDGVVEGHIKPNDV
ncbi:MAG: hypothetical protein KDB29_14740, partial [Planctomycetes bacterium]|nr:hypothetical protein [Planctomycetota bacterium]